MWRECVGSEKVWTFYVGYIPLLLGFGYYFIVGVCCIIWVFVGFFLSLFLMRVFM